MKESKMGYLKRLTAALLLLCVGLAPAIGADIKISAMPPAATIIGNEAIPAVQAGANVRISPVQLKGFVNPFSQTATSIAGSKMQVDNLLETSGFPIANEGGIWSGGTYSYFGVSKELTNGTVAAEGGAPLAALFSYANNNGATGDVVAIVGDAVARQSNGTVFGGNLIARNGSGISNTKLVGLEVDVEPASATTIGSGSAGFYANIYNIATSAPVFQAGALGGGTWGNGFITSHITGSHYSVLSGDPTTAISFINTANGTFSRTAIVLGNGSAQGIMFGTGGFGTDALFYGDGSHNLILSLGSTDYYRMTNHSGATVYELNAAQKTVRWLTTTVSALPTAGSAGRRAMVTDATVMTFGSIVAGGGTNTVPVYDDGTNWRIG